MKEGEVFEGLEPFLDALASAETDEHFIDEFLALLKFIVERSPDPWPAIAAFAHGVACGRGIQEWALFTFISGFTAYARKAFGDDLFDETAILGIARLMRKVLRSTDEELRVIFDDVMQCSRGAQA